VSPMPGQARLSERLVRAAALGAFGFYACWNVAWIASGRVPQSILQAFTGIPCPTTGGTRSLLAMVHGHWLQALLWNPFTVVYMVLLAYSCAVLLRQFIRRERLVLMPFMAHAWIGSLLAGWVAKLVIGPNYW